MRNKARGHGVKGPRDRVLCARASAACHLAPRPLGRSAPSRGGFTLMEVILAVVITALISVTLFTSMRIAFETRERAEDRLAGRQAARVSLDLLAADVESVLPPTGRIAGPFLGSDGRMGAAREADQLSFITASAMLPTEGDLGDLRGVEIALADDPESDDTQMLVRYVTTNLMASTTPQPTTQVLARGVVSFNARYFDGGDWLDDWDSTEQEDTLPRAIEVTLTIRPEQQRENPDGDFDADDITIVRLIRLPAAPQPASTDGGGLGGGGLFSF